MILYKLKKDMRSLARTWGWRNGRAVIIEEFLKLNWSGKIDPDGYFKVVSIDKNSTIVYNINYNYTGWHFNSKFLKYYEQACQPTLIWRQLDKDRQNH